MAGCSGCSSGTQPRFWSPLPCASLVVSPSSLDDDAHTAQFWEPLLGPPRLVVRPKHYRYPPLPVAECANSNSFTTIMNVLPTMLELPWIDLPQKRFRGRDTVSMRGSNWASHPRDIKNTTTHDENQPITEWELSTEHV